MLLHFDRCSRCIAMVLNFIAPATRRDTSNIAIRIYVHGKKVPALLLTTNHKKIIKINIQKRDIVQKYFFIIFYYTYTKKHITRTIF